MTAPSEPIDLGGARVRLLDGGRFRLDGGAMFGIIPKPLWTRATTSDDRNRIQLGANCLLVESGARRIVVEVGLGDKYADKERDIYAIAPGRWLAPSLEAVGIEPGSITDVVQTHLHFDHAGGLTRERDGALTPTFPNAVVHVQRQEFDDARRNFGIMNITYRAENFDPISAAQRWNLLEGDGPIVDRLRAIVTPGHTRAHQSIVIEGADRTLCFSGDVLPTLAHAGPAWNMAYDLFPLDNRASKQRLLDAASRADWLLALGHEPNTPLARVVVDGKWFRVEAL